MNKSRLKPIGQKQREKNAEWKRITDERAEEENYICQWCGKSGRRDDEFNPLDGHHSQRRSRGRIDTPENCYLCHRLCHSEIEDNNVDTLVYKSRKEWLKSKEV